MSGRRGGLWWHREFRLLWLGETTSKLGTSVSSLALPLVAVLTLHAGTFQVGVLTSVAWLPWLLIGLSAGAWVDRLSPRPLMIACDLATVLLLASVPVAAWLGVLTIGQLFVVALLTGVASVFFSTAYQVLLPALLTPAELPEGNAKLQGSESAAQVAGPGLGGLLAQVFGAVTGLLADAVSCLVSLACLLALRNGRTANRARPAAGRTLRREIGAGLRFVFGDPYLRALAIFGATSNMALTGFQAVEVPFLVGRLGLNAGTVGVLTAAVSAGGVLGALVATRIARRFGTARAMLLCELVSAVFGLLVPLTGRGPLLALFVLGDLVAIAGVVAANVIIGPFRQRYCPPGMLGRVVATSRFLSFGAMPVGGLLGGALGTVLGIRPTIWIMMAGFLLAVLLQFLGPIRRLRDLPVTPPDAAVLAAC